MQIRAVVLAGGLGSRMSPVVGEDEPKALLPVGNRPAIFYSILSAIRAGVTDVLVITARPHTDAIRRYFQVDLPNDPVYISAISKQNSPARIDVFERDDSHDTADAIRALELRDPACHALVLSADTVSDVCLKKFINFHTSSQSSCSVFYSNIETVSAASVKDKTAARPEIFVTVDQHSNRLLNVVGDTDLAEGSQLVVRAPLLRRYPKLTVRADLSDGHIYMFAPWIASHLLPARPQISSVRFDLLPYLSRRQFSLAQLMSSENANIPFPGCLEDPVKVSYMTVDHDIFSKRANTASKYLSVALAVTAGALDSYLYEIEARKKGKASKPEKPSFASSGHRVNVSHDSSIGEGCSAGDRSSVKKTLLANAVHIGSNVKLNGCVVLRGVSIGDGSNLAACIVCSGASVGKNCSLRDCRVAAGMALPDNSEASGQDFAIPSGEAATDNMLDEIEFT